ncbi:hypothetical protein [Cellulophaga sp. BC115SP]|uniref:hypothetical protein n=1 Tax=Cellulophaga sp. BC115SP TaxID=2683263 RepID=UPI0014135319|nr:hypothetical protein [Cellulophaga sp. BC115SP]NBB29536.1 hypothetical protein [Cellulophaga sp. BC115SP]
MKNSSVFLGVLAAFGLGTLTGMLIASSKDGVGKDLTERGKNYLEKLRKNYESVKDEIAHKDFSILIEDEKSPVKNISK